MQTRTFNTFALNHQKAPHFPHLNSNYNHNNNIIINPNSNPLDPPYSMRCSKQAQSVSAPAPTSSHSYSHFQSKLKSKYKKQKQERKENLRQINCKKLVQSSDQSNDEEYLKKTGNRWWNRLNRHYFQKNDFQFLENLRIFMLSEDVLEFGAVVSPLLPYYQEVIYLSQPYIFMDDSIRILYRLVDKITHEQQYILAGYLCNPEPSPFQPQPSIFPLPTFYSFHQPLPSNSQNSSTPSQSLSSACPSSLSLSLTATTPSQPYILKCLQYESTWRKQNLTEVQKQLACWQYQLSVQHSINEEYWDRIEAQMEREKEIYGEIDEKEMKEKIQEIKRFLVKCETFSYFRSGYADKSVEEYEKALQYLKEIGEQKKTEKVEEQFFQTDCKVCFCTKNQNCNKVIYCDSCNTSFHQSCYGIDKVDQQKQLICDVCTYLRKLQPVTEQQQPSCQICGRSKFPIKNINNHFYHISCLVLFDFAQISEFRISLKPGIDHKKIMQSVIENEMQHDYCEYCLKNSFSGMQFKCSYPLCAKSYHPICAYLNGCLFSIARRDIGGIDVKVECRDHTMRVEYEVISQVYLRRFLCNFRHTSQKKQEQFKKIYQKQLEKITKSSKLQELSQSSIQRIFKIRRTTSQANNSTDKKRHESMKKSQSVISNNSNSKSLIQLPKTKRAQSNKQKTNHQKF